MRFKNGKQGLPISEAIEPFVDDVFALGRYVVEDFEHRIFSFINECLSIPLAHKYRETLSVIRALGANLAVARWK